MPSARTPGRRSPSAATVTALTPPSTPNRRPTLDQTDEHVRALWYGDPGLSKTTCAATMATGGKVIYIDAERRLKAGPLRRVAETLGIDPSFIANIEPVVNTDYDALITLTDEIRDRINDGEKIFGVVWDSVTEQHRAMLEALVDDSVARAMAKGEYRNPIRLYQEDYGDMAEQMRRVLRRLKDLPCHLGITALPRRDQDENKALRVAAGVTPAVYRDLAGAVDYIIHMRYEAFSDVEGDDEYSGLCRPQGPFDAKDTYGVLPTRLVNPTFPRLLAYASGELTPKTDPLQQQARERRRELAASVTADVKAQATNEDAIQEDA